MTIMKTPPYCVFCYKDFSGGHTSQKMESHLRSHIQEKPFFCKLCEMCLGSTNSLHLHMMWHNGEKRFKCKICSTMFRQRAHLTYHLRTHTKEKKYICKYCGKAVGYANSLKGHIAHFHSGGKKLECDKCGKKFYTMDKLKIHQRTHMDTTPYQCEFCKKFFTTGYNLKLHSSVHKEHERPFICKTCGTSFRLKGSLSSHMKVHRDETPYKCVVCEKAFKHKISYNAHVLIHTGERPFKCDVCGAGFVCKSNLKRHVKSPYSHLERWIKIGKERKAKADERNIPISFRSKPKIKPEPSDNDLLVKHIILEEVEIPFEEDHADLEQSSIERKIVLPVRMEAKGDCDKRRKVRSLECDKKPTMPVDTATAACSNVGVNYKKETPSLTVNIFDAEGLQILLGSWKLQVNLVRLYWPFRNT